MEYGEKLYLPSRAPMKYTPAISKHTKTVANEKPIVTTFKYHGHHNYWGGGDSGVVWGSNKDSLFNCNSKYRYSSESECGGKVSKCEYNKFHQMVSKVETNGNDSHKIVTNYSDEGGKLDDQPTTYELPKKEVVSYECGAKARSQKFVKTYKHDEWGNTLEETTANGICIVSEYYKAEGEDGCPQHPFGMMAYVKKRTYHSIEEKTKYKEDSFTYQSIPGTRAVLPLSEKHGDLTKSYTYFDGSTPELCGISKSEKVTVNGKSTTTSWKYDIQDDLINITDTVTGHDGKSLTRSRKLSHWTGLVCSETDENGVVTKYTRDKSGRLLSETTGVGTEYKIKTTYKYVDKPTDPESNQQIGLRVEQTTDTGATVHTYYDAEHNELAAYQKDEHGTLRKLSEKQYDSQERLVSESELDYILTDTGEVEKTMCEKTSYKFDSWGQKSETHHDNGTVDIVDKDPISLTTTQQTIHKDSHSSLNRVVSTQDEYGNHISTEVFTPDGKSYSKSTFTYDSFGRKTSFTTPTGHTAKITQYDQLDRPTEFVHYDGTTFKISYADFSTESLVSSISVPSFGVTLGQREYDGLSRTVCSTVSGVKTRFSYKGGLNHPSSRIDMKGNTTLFDYIPELDLQVSRVASFTNTVSDDAWGDDSKVSESSFTFSKKTDASHGSIVSAVNSNSHYTYSYTKSGFIKAVTQTVGKNSHTVTAVKTTVADKPLSNKVGDRMVSCEYDKLGSVVSITDGDIKVEFEEDKFGRLSRKVVRQLNAEKNSHDLVQTTLTDYDGQSREITRSVSAKRSGVTLTLKSEFDAEDKLIQRVTAINEVDSLTESFAYDSKKRLLKHATSNCKADMLLPRNENGKQFVSQSFAFDGLDNITSIETSFPNSDIDKATFTHHHQHKQRLMKISHSLTSGDNAYQPTVTFDYDADGHLLQFNGSKMSYTVSGRLSHMDGRSYSYDAYDRLVQSDKTTHFYSGQHVVKEFDGSSTTDIIRCETVPICEIRNGSKTFYGVDHKSSVVLATDDTSGKSTCTNHSAFGNGEGCTRIGFNGELRDVGGHGMYHLGNGTRVYFPAFCGFSSPDTFSPFLSGGINPFMYACGNPVTAIDPSGHVSIWTILGAVIAVAALIAVPFTGGSSIAIVLGVIGGICGVVSSGLDIGAEIAEENGNHELSKNLKIASYAFAAAGFLAGMGEAGYSIGKVVKSGLSARAVGSLKGITKAGDRFVTTGYTTKYAVRFKPYFPKKGQWFKVVKMKNGKLQESAFMKRKVWDVKKFGCLRVRKVRVPDRVFTGGEYAGMTYALRKRCTVKFVFTGFKMGGFSYKTVKFSKYMSNDNSEHGEDDQTRMECGNYMAVFSAHGLPTTPKQLVAPERMLFN